MILVLLETSTDTLSWSHPLSIRWTSWAWKQNIYLVVSSFNSVFTEYCLPWLEFRPRRCYFFNKFNLVKYSTADHKVTVLNALAAFAMLIPVFFPTWKTSRNGEYDLLFFMGSADKAPFKQIRGSPTFSQYWTFCLTFTASGPRQSHPLGDRICFNKQQ